MSLFIRRLFVLIIGIVLLVGPTALRENFWQSPPATYTPPDVPALALAATPIPTPTAQPLNEVSFVRDDELRAGAVVMDLAHANFLNPSSLQPLADSLADRGLGLRYWISTVDPMTVVNYLDYPDQSAELATQLADASGLIIASPFFLWTAPEIALVEQFVADGGRLLLISDPDVMGDFAAATNMIGEPFGVVFNEDYLYDTTTNDGNFTFFFQESTLSPETGEADTGEAPLAGSTIAFYGGRSLSGDLQPLLQSVETTLSSLRVGRSGFTTAAIAGLSERDTAGGVLALSDLDVLTEPYRQRHDNQRLVDYAAEFLNVDERIKRVVDFPDYLGKEVALAFGASDAINGNLILQGAQIQQNLEQSGRSLILTDSAVLTGTGAINTENVNIGNIDTASVDMIYLAAYTTAMSQTVVLHDLGIELYSEVATKTVAIAAPTSVTPAAEEGIERIEETSLVSSISPLTEPVTVTATNIITIAVVTDTQVISPAESTTQGSTIVPSAPVPSTTESFTATTDLTAVPKFEIRTVITTYLQTEAGLTFLADETVLVIRTVRPDGNALLAVLAANSEGIDTGVTRLLNNDFSDCVIGNVLTFCAFSLVADGSTNDSTASAADETGESQSTGAISGEEIPFEVVPTGPGGSPPRGADAPILLIDDNSAADPSEVSEADIYLQLLLAEGYEVDLWSVADYGDPAADYFAPYGWVIWSNGGYASGEIDNEDLETIFTFVSQSGRLTVSSRRPLPGLDSASPIRDLVIEPGAEAITDGLPTTPILLDVVETTSALLNALAEDDPATQIIMRRGLLSDNEDVPALVILADPTTGESEARLMVAAFSMAWLPETDQATLIRNMAEHMLSP